MKKVEDGLLHFLMRLAGYLDLFAILGIAMLAIAYSAASRKLKNATASTWLGIAYGIIAAIGSYIAISISF